MTKLMNSPSRQQRPSAAIRGLWALTREGIGSHPSTSRRLTLYLAAGAIALPLSAWPLKLLVDAVVRGDTGQAVESALAVAALALVVPVSITMQALVGQRLTEHVRPVLQSRVASVVACRTGIDHFEDPTYLERLSLVTAGQDRLASSAASVLALLAFGLQVTTALVLLATVGPIAAVLVVCALPAALLLSYGNRVVDRATQESTELARRHDHLVVLCTTPAAAKEVRVYRLAGLLGRRADQVWSQVTVALVRAHAKSGIAAATGWAVLAIGYALTLAHVLTSVATGRTSIGEVALVFGLAGQTVGHVRQGLAHVASMGAILRIASHYHWLLARTSDNRLRQEQQLEAQPAARERSGITVSHLSFRYPGRSSAALDDVSLHLPLGKTIALVGENGAGKSTLVALLCRCYEPSAGSIHFGETELSQVDPVQWRRHIGAVFQDFARFEFELKEAVGIGTGVADAPDDAVLAALKRAAAPTLVGRLPRGLSTQLGVRFPGGVQLSGGEWQKVAVARALAVSQPWLLVLDEPSASLDPHSELLLLRRYAEAAQATAANSGGITLIVSHRLSAVRAADLVVSMQNGRVDEMGTHEELLERRGRYAELYRVHARGCA